MWLELDIHSRLDATADHAARIEVLPGTGQPEISRIIAARQALGFTRH
jgi:hypothetical protein